MGDLLKCIAARLSLRCIRIAVLPLSLTVHYRVGKSGQLFFKFDWDISWSHDVTGGHIAVAHLRSCIATVRKINKVWPKIEGLCFPELFPSYCHHIACSWVSNMCVKIMKT